jgi:hypothetical protein
LVLDPGQRELLESVAKSRTAEHRLVQRAQVLLHAADFAAAYAWELLYGHAFWLPSELSPCGTDANAEQIRHLLQIAAVTTSAFNGLVTVWRLPQGPISNVGGLRSLRQPVSGAVGVSKKESVMDWAHFDVANTTCGS